MKLSERTRDILWTLALLGGMHELSEWIERHYPQDALLPVDGWEALAWAALFTCWGLVVFLVTKDRKELRLPEGER